MKGLVVDVAMSEWRGEDLARQPDGSRKLRTSVAAKFLETARGRLRSRWTPRGRPKPTFAELFPEEYSSRSTSHPQSLHCLGMIHYFSLPIFRDFFLTTSQPTQSGRSLSWPLAEGPVADWSMEEKDKPDRTFSSLSATKHPEYPFAPKAPQGPVRLGLFRRHVFVYAVFSKQPLNHFHFIKVHHHHTLTAPGACSQVWHGEEHDVF